MNIIIVGAGVIGSTIAQKLSREGHDVVVIEKDEKKIRELEESLDARIIQGSGSSPHVLMNAGIEKTDMVIAVTNSDEVNMIACLIAGTQSRVPKKIARIRDRDYASYTRIFEQDYLDLDLNINPEKMAAKRILRIIQVPGAVDVIDFVEGKLKLVGCRLTSECPAVGKKAKKLKKVGQNGKLRIVAIYRGSETIIPKESTVLASGDLVFALTLTDDTKNLLKLLKGTDEQTGKKVIVVGGGDVGYYLAERLEGEGYQVKIIENNEKRANFLAENLDKTIVIRGDGTDKNLLLEENVSETDTFIAVTDDEEANVLTSLLAKRLNAERCITLIDKEEYLSMVSTIGIDVAVSPRLESVSGILQFVRRGKIVSVTTLMEERVEALETVAMETSDIVGVPIKNIKFPQGAVIGAVVKGEEVMLADDDAVINPGDKVIIFALRETISKVEKSLMVKPEFF